MQPDFAVQRNDCYKSLRSTRRYGLDVRKLLLHQNQGKRLALLKRQTISANHWLVQTAEILRSWISPSAACSHLHPSLSLPYFFAFSCSYGLSFKISTRNWPIFYVNSPASSSPNSTQTVASLSPSSYAASFEWLIRLLTGFITTRGLRTQNCGRFQIENWRRDRTRVFFRDTIRYSKYPALFEVSWFWCSLIGCSPMLLLELCFYFT